MKAFLLGSIASLGLTLALHGQSPTATPEIPSATPTATLSAPTISPAPVSATPIVTPTPASALADQIKAKVDRKFKHKGFDTTIDGDDQDEHGRIHGNDIPEGVFPLAAISMLTVFGFPVAIVAVIMFSSWAKARSLHRTVRMMVEKGQPVPPELFTTPGAGAPIRPWYDLRRGIVLLSVGFGLMMFFGLTAGWDEGVWALGLIPGLIGLGYILAWRLANRHANGFKQ
ncbi:MAG: hypothetical protein DLM52_09865 [Chthoniobacterales bacterium]|nr:MAG: hypothetical protein DLM52_09865 [Chthoniobacterales bacterium]